MTRSTQWLFGVLGAVAVLIVVAFAVSVTAGGETDFPSDTPEGTVQTYLRAIADRDAEAAWAIFSDELQNRCSISNVRDALRYRPSDFRAHLGDVSPRDGTTDVFVEVTERYGDGVFGGGESTFEQIFSLTEVEDGWRLVEAPWPLWCPTEPIR